MNVAIIRRNAPLFLDIKSFRRAIDGIDDYDIRIHKAARWYADNGFHIVPFGHWGTYPKGLSQRHATKNINTIDEWWHPVTGKYKGAAIAMAHGGQSGFCAIDLDRKSDVDGISNLADLQAAYGQYDDSEGEGLQTLMAKTPSGGRHLVFRYHPEIISNSEVAYPGIDCRGGLKSNPVENGGITFVEPSRKPKSDKTDCYMWDDEIEQIIDIPQWLVDVLNGRKPRVSTGGIQLQESYVQSASGDHGEGRDRNIYMDLMRFVGIGYTEEQLWALMPDILKRMDPPDEAMVRRKIESAIASDAFRKAQEEQHQRTHADSLKLDKSDKGRILPSAKNLATIIKSPVFEFEYGVVEYDDFYQRFTLNKAPIASVADYTVGIQLWISNVFGVEFAVTTIRQTLEYIAYSEKPHANAARDYMLSLQPYNGPRDPNYWGSERPGPGPAFKRLTTEVMKFDSQLHTGYTPEVRAAYEGFLWFWLRGATARACVPGCKVEIMLNIFGGQGIGKSTFFRDLCPDPKWFTDGILDTIVTGGKDNKDELSKLHAKLIVEMPELSPIKKGGKAADDKIKQFLSAQIDSYRRSYGIDTIDHPRTCVFGGTSNNNDIYRDATGDRRFVSINHGKVPISVADLDRGVMSEIRDALWAEVVSSFLEGELQKPPIALHVSLPPLLRSVQTEVNEQHRYDEIGLEDITEWMSDKTRVTWPEVIEYARTISGLKDVKESHIMLLVRQNLNNNGTFQFKKRVIRNNPAGEKEKANCWVNLAHPEEQNQNDGFFTAPKHWSKSQPQIPEEY